MVWHGPQFLHTKECTHFISDAADKVSTASAQEHGQGPEDQDVTLIQELGDCFNCLIGGHICHKVLHEMVLEHQDIGNSRQLVQLHCHPYAGKIYMEEVQWSGGYYWVWRSFRQIALMLQAMHTGLD